MAVKDLWRNIVKPQEHVSKEFEHMFMREVMREEMVRVRVLMDGEEIHAQDVEIESSRNNEVQLKCTAPAKPGDPASGTPNAEPPKSMTEREGSKVGVTL